MPAKRRRKQCEPPTYEYHISGSARVRIDSTDYYLGDFGSRDSRQLYALLIAEYEKLGEAPDPDWLKKKKAKLEKKRVRKQAKQGAGKDVVTVAAVTALFRLRINEIYAADNTERGRFLGICDLLDYEYGETSVDDFRPSQLKEIRAHFILSGNNRRYVNEQTNRVKLIFAYAAGEGDLIDQAVADRLAGVAAVRKEQKVTEAGGRSPAESKKTRIVPLAEIQATVVHLSPTLRAMVALLASTGMRPSEVFNLTPGEVDQSGEIWIYRPEKHKTAHLGVEKQVPILGEARVALEEFMDRPADKPCFSPAESKQWYLDQRHGKRKTPPGQGSYRGSRAEQRAEAGLPKAKRQAGDRWSKDSFNRAIRRGCEKAGVDRWTPYALRHTVATLVKEGLSAEHVQALLNHKHIKTQDIYARNSVKKAIEAAQMTPELGIFKPDDDDTEVA